MDRMACAHDETGELDSVERFLAELHERLGAGSLLGKVQQYP